MMGWWEIRELSANGKVRVKSMHYTRLGAVWKSRRYSGLIVVVKVKPRRRRM